jgi:pimeloyl-ACP methyl ester carboxylesterase
MFGMSLKPQRAWLFAAVIAAVFSVSPSLAEEVKTEHQGLDVTGNLEIVPGKSLKHDGVVLLVHGTLGHHRMEIMSALQELLRERGINSLAITLSLGLNERRGMFDCSIEQDHRNEDGAEEIRTWVYWLKTQGAANIVVAGHSRGGNQAAIYAAKYLDKAVRKLVLIAPLAQTEGSAAADYQMRFHKPLQPVLAEAEKRVAEDDSMTLLTGVGFLNCDDARVTAGAFVNYYGPNQNLYTPSLLPFVKVPALVVAGELDPLTAELAPAIEGIPDTRLITFKTIRGADHYFRDLAAEDLANAIKEFVQQKQQQK